MANLHLRFFDKQGDPLNFAYVGPTGSVNLDTSYLYYSTNTGSTPAEGYISFADIDNGFVYLNTTDRTRGNLIPWAQEVLSDIIDGATILKVGYFLTTSLFLMGSYYFLGERRWILMFLLSFPFVAAFMYLLHGVLDIYLRDPFLQMLGVMG